MDNYFENINNPYNKTLVLNKINIDANIEIKEKIESLFSDPAKYFANESEGHRIVIGKKQRCPRFDTDTAIRSYSVIGNPRMFTKRKSFARQNSVTSLINMSTVQEKLKKPPKNNFEVVSDNAIYDIFEQHKSTKRAMTTHQNTFLKELNTQIKHELQFQENSLKIRQENEKQGEKLTKLICKKVRKQEKDLLMNRTDGFRVRKEICERIEESKGPEEKYGVNTWVMSLRKMESSQGPSYNYINMGTNKRPHWQIVKEVNPHLMETIRHPDRTIDRDVKQVTSNEHFKRSMSNFKLVTNQFENLKINGKDLLQAEYDNCKLLKGKKILHVNNNFNETKKINELIASGK